MIKLVLTQSLLFNSKEELIDKLIKFVKVNEYEMGTIRSAPTDYEDPKSWTDEAVQYFLDKKGGSFLYGQLDNFEEIEEWMDDSEKSGATYQLVEI